MGSSEDQSFTVMVLPKEIRRSALDLKSWSLTRSNCQKERGEMQIKSLEQSATCHILWIMLAAYTDMKQKVITWSLKEVQSWNSIKTNSCHTSQAAGQAHRKIIRTWNKAIVTIWAVHDDPTVYKSTKISCLSYIHNYCQWSPYSGWILLFQTEPFVCAFFISARE